MKRTIALSVFLATLVAGIVFVAWAQDRVLLKDVTSLIFRAGSMTTGRRSAPIPQLRCTGRSCKTFQPQVVQCTQTGWDGRDATWRCEADLPPKLSFGQVVVSCEGYNYPDDPYILVGSCGLKYQLVDAARPSNDDDDTFVIGTVLGVIVTAVIAAIVISKCCSRYRATRGDDMPPPPPYDDYHRMPSSWRPSAPPSSSASCNPQPAQSSSGPGFFTGLGIGGLAGYAFGNRSRRNHAVYTTPDYGYSRSSSGRSMWGSSSSTSSSAQSQAPSRSTGFATTERR